MAENVYYSLDVNGKGKYNSFRFKTKKDAIAAFNFISEKFSDHRMVRSRENYSSDIVQLTVSETFVGRMDNVSMASFVPEEWFLNVYDEMLATVNNYNSEYLVNTTK